MDSYKDDYWDDLHLNWTIRKRRTGISGIDETKYIYNDSRVRNYQPIRAYITLNCNFSTLAECGGPYSH